MTKRKKQTSRRKQPTSHTMKKLFGLSGNLCAYPECRKIMSDTENVFGQICHIEGARPDAPRYNKHQSDDERRAFGNLILLCYEHHIITNNTKLFTVTVLKEMKANHEARFLMNRFHVSPQIVHKARDKFVAEQISSSEFGFEKLLRETSKHIVICGQNLFHLTREENKDKYKNLVFAFLRKEKNRRVQIMVCNPKHIYSVQTWQFVTAKEYKSHLDHSIRTFREWTKEARKKRLNGFQVKVTIMVPLSITFLDPEEVFAKLVFVPVVYNPISHTRPCYLVEKDVHPYVFDYYWQAYKYIFQCKADAINAV